MKEDIVEEGPVTQGVTEIVMIGNDTKKLSAWVCACGGYGLFVQVRSQFDPRKPYIDRLNDSARNV